MRGFSVIIALIIVLTVSMATSQIMSHTQDSDNVDTSQEKADAILIGRVFLESISCKEANYTAGKILSLSLENKTANFYWHELAQLSKPDVTGLRLTCVVRFEQALRLGHFFEVWVDSEIDQVVGGEQCR